MLSVKNLEDFISKVKYEDFDTSGAQVDDSGDLLTVVDSESRFLVIKKKVMENPILNKKIVSNGVDHVELVDDNVWIDGNRVRLAILVSPIISNTDTGVSIKMMVKTVEATINGEKKMFLGFESYRAYKEMVQK